MRLNAKRNSLSLLFLFCILFLGMCFGSIPADSLLECANPVSAAAGNTFPAASIDSPGKALPAEQAFEHKTLSHSDAVLSLRHTVRKSIFRIGRGNGSVFSFSLLPPRVFTFFTCSNPHEFFHDFISTTIIISYIHQKDGQKASSPFIF